MQILLKLTTNSAHWHYVFIHIIISKNRKIFEKIKTEIFSTKQHKENLKMEEFN